MAKRDQHTDDDAGYPVGNRTDRPHSKSGWHPAREQDSNGGGNGGRRGSSPASGEHDRPTRH